MVLAELFDDPLRQRLCRHRPVSLNFAQVVALANAIAAQHHGIARRKHLAADIWGADRMAEHAGLADQGPALGAEYLTVGIADLHESEVATFKIQNTGNDDGAAPPLSCWCKD